jgi:hypothetical protein
MNVHCSQQNLDECPKPNMMNKCRKLINGVLLLPRLSSNSKSTINVVSTTETPNHPAKRTPCVAFNFVEIREYGRIISDHPECKDGIALGLDWKHSSKITRISIDLFERIRRSQGRKTIKSLQRLTVREKQYLLVKVGGYQEDIILNAYFKHSQTLNDAIQKLKAPAA